MSSTMILALPQAEGGPTVVKDVERIILEYVDGFLCGEAVTKAKDNAGGVWAGPVCIYTVSANAPVLDRMRRSILAYLEEHTDIRALYAPILPNLSRSVFYVPSEFSRLMDEGAVLQP